ncbi:BatD family protein [Singulisphaera sp. PoT]|uniref:BatD family protein n=1 Tax=Singulisphaera sp. PoT TaxID=3411797 RepID=UPI003BF5A0B3
MRRTHAATAALTVMLLALLGAPTHGAEEPEVEVEAGASEVFTGESIDYVIDVRNVKTPAAPDLSALREDFDIKSLGDESHNQSSTLIINGRVIQQESFGHYYRYRLTPRRGGALTIPAPTVTVDGKTYSGGELTLKVTAPETQDLVVAEIKTSRRRVYPTQPFDVTLRILVRPLPDDPDRDPLRALVRKPPHLDVPWVDPPTGLTADDKSQWLQDHLARDGIGFTLNEFKLRSMSFFEGPPSAVFHLAAGRESRPGLDGKPINYFAYELKRTFTAEASGTFTFGAALIKGRFVDGEGGSAYTSKALAAVAPAATIEVRDVPSPRPAGYCGGVGNYTLAATAAPKALRVGDPLTLTLEVARQEGSGSLNQISAPDLTANKALAADFDIVDRSPTGRSEGDVKRFDYALRPKRAGASIPALSASVFNPDTEAFSEIQAPPIALNVSEASSVGAGDLVGSLGRSSTPQVRSREQGIFQNVTDPSGLGDERVNLVVLASVAAGSWVVAGCLIAFVGSHRRKSGDLDLQRRRNARKAAERRLDDARKALAEGRSRESLRALRSSLVGLIADTRNLVAEGLTARDADIALSSTSVPVEERSAVLGLLNDIEAAEYGSGAGSEVSAMIDKAAALLPSLARQLERGPRA